MIEGRRMQMPLRENKMKLKPNTEPWRVWRNKGIGSSDAPVIMGVSPWGNLKELGLYKRNLKKKDEGNFATRRGTEMEPVARAYFELQFDMDFPEALFEHEEFNFLRASLDGYNKETKRILEIKCPGKESHEQAIAGEVPLKYFWQLQHQLLVTGAKDVLYASYHPEYSPKGATVIMTPDLPAIDRLVQREMWFWDLIQRGEDPSLVDPDRINRVCASKKYYGSREEATEKLAEENHIFNCCFCNYYHISTRRGVEM